MIKEFLKCFVSSYSKKSQFFLKNKGIKSKENQLILNVILDCKRDTNYVIERYLIIRD